MRSVFLIGTIGLAACLSLLLTIIGVEYVNVFTDVALIALTD